MTGINIEKKILGELTKCYSLAPLHYKGKSCLLVAAEKQDPCLLFDIDGQYLDTVWEGPGGTMTMVQVPGSDGQFLAVHQFYSPNDSAKARIVIATPPKGDQTDGGWTVKTLVNLPFVHRFDILERNGHRYLLACTLKSDHEHKDDWTHPGKVYASVLPENLDSYNEDSQLPLNCIMDGLGHNHGYTRDVDNDVVCGIISCDQGVFRFIPPLSPQEDWKVETLLDIPTSDAVLVDLNGDGKKELVSIAPFHGDQVAVYEEHHSGYECAFRCPARTKFAHAIAAGTICGKNRAIIGHREGDRNLLMIEHGEAGYSTTTIDKDVGPANVYLFHYKDADMILSANRETDEIALYRITKGG